MTCQCTNKPQPHKWAKEIKAWADGAKIQFKNSTGLDVWQDSDFPSWATGSHYEYRIKPTVKEFTIYKNLFKNGFGPGDFPSYEAAEAAGLGLGNCYIKTICITERIEV